MAATPSQLRLLIDGLAGIADARLNALLDAAATHLESDGIDTTDARYNLLQMYMAGHLLSINGGPGAIASESVDGVSISFRVTAKEAGTTAYLDAYRQLLGQVRGFEARFA